MAGKARFSQRQVREAIAGSLGNKTTIAQRLNCTRATVDNYLKRYPQFADMLTNERETLVDKAENKLNELVEGGEIRAILFVLETLGKGRGYTKRTEVTGADGADLMKLSPDVVALLRQMGIEPSRAVAEFEALVRAQASAE